MECPYFSSKSFCCRSLPLPAVVNEEASRVALAHRVSALKLRWPNYRHALCTLGASQTSQGASPSLFTDPHFFVKLMRQLGVLQRTCRRGLLEVAAVRDMIATPHLYLDATSTSDSIFGNADTAGNVTDALCRKAQARATPNWRLLRRAVGTAACFLVTAHIRSPWLLEPWPSIGISRRIPCFPGQGGGPLYSPSGFNIHPHCKSTITAMVLADAWKPPCWSASAISRGGSQGGGFRN